MKTIRALLLAILAFSAAPAFADFHVGDRVECNWKNGGRFYPGRIADKEGHKLFIHYDDGDRERTYSDMCRPLVRHDEPMGMMEVGSRVSCDWKGRGTWYPGVIAEKNGHTVFIHYKDGDREWTKLSMCRPR